MASRRERHERRARARASDDLKDALGDAEPVAPAAQQDERARGQQGAERDAVAPRPQVADVPRQRDGGRLGRQRDPEQPFRRLPDRQLAVARPRAPRGDQLVFTTSSGSGGVATGAASTAIS